MKVRNNNHQRKDEKRKLRISGFWILPIVPYSKNTKEHKVSETGSVSVLR
jgi:hypothetical protein